MSQASFQKRQREKQRQERAEAKQMRRQERRDRPDEPAPAPVAGQAATLEALAQLHAAFADEQMSFEEFEEAKARLTAQLRV